MENLEQVNIYSNQRPIPSDCYWSFRHVESEFYRQANEVKANLIEIRNQGSSPGKDDKKSQRLEWITQCQKLIQAYLQLVKNAR